MGHYSKWICETFFLQGDLEEEEVFMNIPPGLVAPSKNGLVCRLRKAIYGLKQSPRAWYGKLSSVLVKVGFKRSDADSSMSQRNQT
jgi:Reverse transcriptase (RNA-dependent DNA polymerase)